MMTEPSDMRQNANLKALENMFEADPVFEDVGPARLVVPGFADDLILTSGPTMVWSAYSGGQREAILGAAQFEGLAASPEDADQKLKSGEIRVRGAQEYSCVGSVAGVYSASMPVLVIRNRKHGNVAFCNFYEGTNPRRLNYGVYDENVRQQLKYVGNIVAPTLGAAIRRSGGIALKPIMKRALNMGDELHSRNNAAGLLFLRELLPHLVALHLENGPEVDRTIEAIAADQYFFLRFSMAAAKATADAAHGVEGSSLVTAMCFNCREFAIRISGLADTWFTGPHPQVAAKLFEGYETEDIAWMGGESPITETIGLGGFAQACAPSLQDYQGGSVQSLIDKTLEMYNITLGENPDYLIAYLGYRGTPTGIDIFKVVRTGITPIMDIGIAGKGGGQIGAGTVRADIGCFEAAQAAFQQRYSKIGRQTMMPSDDGSAAVVHEGKEEIAQRL
jgi:hypothetical protein